MVVIDFVSFWCIDVPSMVAISLTGLFSAHIMDKSCIMMLNIVIPLRQTDCN